MGRCFPDERYSVPSEHAGHHVSLRAYADRIVVVADNEIIADRKRRFTRNISYFEPWHYVPLPGRKPGALRDGAPFVDWELPKAMEQTKDHYVRGKGGDPFFRTPRKTEDMPVDLARGGRPCIRSTVEQRDRLAHPRPLQQEGEGPCQRQGHAGQTEHLPIAEHPIAIGQRHPGAGGRRRRDGHRP